MKQNEYALFSKHIDFLRFSYIVRSTSFRRKTVEYILHSRHDITIHIFFFFFLFLTMLNDSLSRYLIMPISWSFDRTIRKKKPIQGENISYVDNWCECSSFRRKTLKFYFRKYTVDFVDKKKYFRLIHNIKVDTLWWYIFNDCMRSKDNIY